METKILSIHGMRFASTLTFISFFGFLTPEFVFGVREVEHMAVLKILRVEINAFLLA